MARLSVEHYRANATMTPEHARKTKRFRDMFLRGSMSPRTPSASEMPTSEIPPQALTFKPGFERVGVLPSERSSLLDITRELEMNDGPNIAEVLREQAAAPKGSGAAHSVDNKLEPTGVHSQEDGASMAGEKQHKEAEADDFAEAFKTTLSEHQAKPSEKLAESPINDSMVTVTQAFKDVNGYSSESSIPTLKHAKPAFLFSPKGQTLRTHPECSVLKLNADRSVVKKRCPAFHFPSSDDDCDDAAQSGLLESGIGGKRRLTTVCYTVANMK